MPLRTPKPILLVLELAERERRFILSETVKVKGLMPVLMKRRNKQQSTEHRFRNVELRHREQLDDQHDHPDSQERGERHQKRLRNLS